VRFCAAILEAPELAADPRFSDNTRRVANRPALDRIVAERFARDPRGALGKRLKAADIAFGNLNEVADFSAHPHLRRLAVPTPGGEVDVPAPPGLPSEARPRPVPALGEHGEAIRREFGT
jgi:crotonobetainyl-CoA:carnitine CoA-transferase CaiB-like acyl-CoA transferase